MPAAVLLHTADTDGSLLGLADELGVACQELPSSGVLRESVRPFWDLVSTFKIFYITKEAGKILRHVPVLCRRMISQGTFCLVDNNTFEGLEPHSHKLSTCHHRL